MDTTAPAITSRDVLSVANHLADLLAESGIEWSDLTITGGSGTTGILLHIEGGREQSPHVTAELLGLAVESTESYPKSRPLFSVANAMFEGVPVSIFGALIDGATS